MRRYLVERKPSGFNRFYMVNTIEAKTASDALEIFTGDFCAGDEARVTILDVPIVAELSFNKETGDRKWQVKTNAT